MITKEQRTLMARIAVVATLALSAAASWAVTGAMSQAHGVTLTAGK